MAVDPSAPPGPGPAELERFGIVGRVGAHATQPTLGGAGAACEGRRPDA